MSLLTRRGLLRAAGFTAPALIIPKAWAQLEACLPAFCAGSPAGGCAPITPDTWDPLTNHNTTLTAGNLTVTNTGAGTTDQGARTTTDWPTGKYYFEIQMPTPGIGGFREGHGVCTPATPYTSFCNNGVNGVWLESGTGSTNIYSNGTLVYTTGVSSVAKICWAVDLDNRKAWVRNPGGNWNGNATFNPLTLVGGVTIPAGNMMPACTFGGFGGAPGRVLTANFGATSFVDTPPAGYICGWPGVAVPPPSCTGTIDMATGCAQPMLGGL